MLSKHRTDWATSLALLTRFLIPSVRLQLKLVDAPVWTFYYHHLGLLSVQMSRLLTAAVVLVSEKSHPIPTPTTCIWGTSLNLTLQLTFCPWLQSHGHVLIQNSLSLKSSHSDFLNIQCLATCWQAGILRGSVDSLCVFCSPRVKGLSEMFFLGWKKPWCAIPLDLGRERAPWDSGPTEKDVCTVGNLLLWVRVAVPWYLVRALGTGGFQPAEVRWE